MIPLDEIWVIQRWQAAREMMLSVSGCRLRKDVMIRPLTGDVNPGHLVKVVSASFLQCRVTLFPFVKW